MNYINRKRANEIINSLESCVDIQNINVKTYIQKLQKIGENLVNNYNFKKIIEFSNAFGNKERLKIITVLKKKDYCVCELEAILDKSQPSISHHLRILESVGFIRSFKKGKFTHYDIVKEQFELYLNLLHQELDLKVLFPHKLIVYNY